jgi:hypothetical protein
MNAVGPWRTGEPPEDGWYLCCSRFEPLPYFFRAKYVRRRGWCTWTGLAHRSLTQPPPMWAVVMPPRDYESTDGRYKTAIARLNAVRCWLLGEGEAHVCGDGPCETCRRDCYVAEGLRILDGRVP